MCCNHGPDFFLLVSAGSLLGYDLLVGAKNFFSWTRKRGFQSLKAMGLISAILCMAGGAIYAGWNDFPYRVRDLFSAFLAFGLFGYPLIDFVGRVRAKQSKFGWRIPFLMLSLYFIVFAWLPAVGYSVSLWF